MARKLDNERGARKAAELKRRFGRVSRKSFGSRFGADISRRSGADGPSSISRNVMIWIAIAIVAIFVGNLVT